MSGYVGLQARAGAPRSSSRITRITLQALTIAAIASQVRAQRSQATCTSSWLWLNTESGTSPCVIAAQLLSMCSNAFTLPAGGPYTLGGSGSSSSNAAIRANICSCNVVMYNLLSGCQACQGSAGGALQSWQTYAAACPTCYSDTGMSPGPCKGQASVGFPNSVNPDGFSVAIPEWAYVNTSGGSWSDSAARRYARGDKTTLRAPSAPSATSGSSGQAKDSGGNDSSSSKSSSDKTDDKEAHAGGLSQPMKIAVYVCSALAAVLALLFGFYIWGLVLRKRKDRQLRAFTDDAFDKVEPARHDSKRDRSPRKSNFRKVMARLTLNQKTPVIGLAFPKTPLFPPKTPRTPGGGMASPPKTARFPRFPFIGMSSPKRSSKRATVEATNEKRPLSLPSQAAANLKAPPPPKKARSKQSSRYACRTTSDSFADAHVADTTAVLRLH